MPVLSHLDFVIISSRHKQRLLFVEIDSSDRAFRHRHIRYNTYLYINNTMRTTSDRH